ncbi:MAG: nucleotidyltransferase [Candidatus Schekmanbacteria bacterium]|nr:nucleotidyltransferase [Candidatus Schekmanbacteria bacterium]
MGIENLLRLLNENKVRYVVIGDTAFPIHGYAGATLDVDLFIQPEQSNAEATWKALKAFGYDVTEITVEDLLNYKILIRQYVVEADIHPFVAGVSFDEVWRHKIAGQIGSVSVHFADLDDLIKMKQAAGRPKDLEDLKILVKLKARK